MVKETANVLDVLDIWRHHEARWRVRVAMRPVVDVESRLTRSSRETSSPLVPCGKYHGHVIDCGAGGERRY